MSKILEFQKVLKECEDLGIKAKICSIDNALLVFKTDDIKDNPSLRTEFKPVRRDDRLSSYSINKRSINSFM